MKNLFPFFILIFSLISFAQKNVPSENKKLVIVGDSLSEGYGVTKASAYPALIEKKLKDDQKNWTVVNSSESGSTSASAPGRIQWIVKTKPQVIFIALGANDGLRGLTIQQMENNLSKAIEIAQASNIKVILGGMYAPPNYGKEYAEKFKAVYPRLAKKYKLHLVPFILDKVAGNPKLNLPDGLHPNEAGHKVMAETIYQSIKGNL